MIGKLLRHWRATSGLGPTKEAAPILGISHATLSLYETEKTLPDVDFLAVFARKTGADFNELLKARLASGKTQEARELAEAVGIAALHDVGKTHPSFMAMLERAKTTLEQNCELIPITPEVEAENQALARIKKELEFIAVCQDAMEKERATADMMLRAAFEKTPAHERLNVSMKKYAGKLANASEKVNNMCTETGYHPSELMKHVLVAMVYDDLIDRQLQMLVSALAQEQQTQPK